VIYKPTASDFNRFFRGRLYGDFDIFTTRSYDDFVTRHDIDPARAVNRFDGDGLAATIVFGRRGDRVWLALMGVRASLRGHGLGAELLAQTLEKLRAQGARSFEFEIVQRNEPARRMVSRFGFEPVGELHTLARRRRRGTSEAPLSRRFDEAKVAALARTPSTCWQREPRSVAAARTMALVTCEGAYAFVRIRTGSATVLDAGAETADAARELARELDACIEHDLTLLNETADSPLERGLLDAGWRIVERQYRFAGA
jgi:GNAT superfamily N-acetyltransferase